MTTSPCPGNRLPAAQLGKKSAFPAEKFPLYSYINIRRKKWQPTPSFLPGESHGQRSLVGCHLWGRTVGHN